eukprot:1018751-Rhodomonas_salina.1
MACHVPVSAHGAAVRSPTMLTKHAVRPGAGGGGGDGGWLLHRLRAHPPQVLLFMLLLTPPRSCGSWTRESHAR